MLAMEPLAVYLNEHVAGATAGVELAQKIASDAGDSPLGTTMSEIAADVAADRKVLQELMATLDVEEGNLRKAAAWMSEKLVRLRTSAAGVKSDSLGLLMELETLSIGIAGKLALWQSLREVAAAHPQLAELDTTTLIQRAREQLARIEPHHRAAAQAALAG